MGYRPAVLLATLLSDAERLERSIVHWITCGWHHEALASVFQAVQSEWIGIPLFLFGASLLSRKDGRLALRALLAGAASFGLCMLLATTLWSVIDRDRPPHHYERWLETEADLQACASQPEAFAIRGHVSSRPSFPSRHAMTIGSFAGALLLASRGLGIVAWCYGIFVALGRIYVGKHWPSDLIAGMAIAMLVVWLCWRALPAVLGRIGLREWVETIGDVNSESTPG